MNQCGVFFVLSCFLVIASVAASLVPGCCSPMIRNCVGKQLIMLVAISFIPSCFLVTASVASQVCSASILSCFSAVSFQSCITPNFKVMICRNPSDGMGDPFLQEFVPCVLGFNCSNCRYQLNSTVKTSSK